MDFIVTMRPKPGDKEISKAEIRMYDASGMELEGQFILEAETVETRLSMPPGGKMIVKDFDRRNVVDGEQKAAVPVGTAEREINWESPNTPLPANESEQRKQEAEYAKKYQKEQEDKKRQHEADAKKTPEQRERDQKDRDQRLREQNDRDQRSYSKDPDVAKGPIDSKQGGHTVDASKTISSSKESDHMDPTKRK